MNLDCCANNCGGCALRGLGQLLIAFVAFAFFVLVRGLVQTLLGEEVENVLDGADVLRVFIPDLELCVVGELFFDRDCQVDNVERIGPEIIDEAGFRLYLGRVDLQLADNNIADAFKNCSQG